MWYDYSALEKALGVEPGPPIWMDESDLEPVQSNFKGYPGMHTPEGLQALREKCGKHSIKNWRLYCDDGRVVEIRNLEGWCKEQGHDPECVRKVGKMQPRGYIYRSYKGIIKVEDIDDPSDYNPWKWTIEKKCGKIEKVFSLNKWCRVNGYNTGAMVSISKGRKDKHKDVIKVVKV